MSATTHRHHAETVLAALAAHKHVLCEPPLALTVAEAEPLVQMAQESRPGAGDELLLARHGGCPPDGGAAAG